MKASIKKIQLEFQPIEVTFTIETEEEALALYDISRMDVSIPRLAEREICKLKKNATENMYKITQNFLGLLRENMRDTVIKIHKRYE